MTELIEMTVMRFISGLPIEAINLALLLAIWTMNKYA